MSDEDKKSVEVEIQDELAIDETRLEEELARQPSKFFYWSTMWAQSARKRRMQRMKTRETEAQLTKEFKEKMLQENPGMRITEKIVEDYLSEHPTYKGAQIELIKAEYLEDMLKVSSDAFKERYGAVVELFKARNDERFQGNEFKVMQTELEQRDAEKQKKVTRKKKTAEESTEEGAAV